MEKGTVYFFTGLAGAGKTTIGGLFYKRLKKIKPDAILKDGDNLRVTSGDHDYSTEARRRGAKSVFRQCKELADQGIDSVYCGIGMYEDVRQWNRENIENYREIYIKVSMETLYRRNQKGLYSPGVKDVVGVDLPWDEPRTPDVVIENDYEENPVTIVDRLFKQFGLSEVNDLNLDTAERDIWEGEKRKVFQKINDKGLPLVIIGRSSATNPAFLEEIHVPIEYVCSNTPKTWGTKWWSKKVISPNELPAIYDKYNALIVVAQFKEQLSAQLQGLPIPPQNIFCLDMYFEKENTPDFFESSMDDIKRTYRLLADQASRDTYEAALKYRLNRDPQYLKDVTLPFKEHYFPLHLGGEPFLNEKEKFVDIGAYTGDTIDGLLSATGGKYSHIYAFEPDKDNFEKLREKNSELHDLSVFPVGIGDQPMQAGISQKGTASVIETGVDGSIRIDTLDNILDGKPVTYIKMDIEGMESAALRGAKGIIKKYKPKLAVCIYHSDWDMVNIPKMILELNPDYKLYVRHYTKCLLETVCYAI